MPSGVYKRKPFTEKHKKGISQGLMGKKRFPFSKRWKKNMSLAHKGIKLSEKHKKNIGLANLADKNNWWKGGIKRCSQGYIWIYSSYHPYVTLTHPYIKEERLVMEKYLKRFLTPEEVVHHKNGIKTDNRRVNLRLFKTTGKHTAYHNHKRALNANT